MGIKMELSAFMDTVKKEFERTARKKNYTMYYDDMEITTNYNGKFFFKVPIINKRGKRGTMSITGEL